MDIKKIADAIRKDAGEDLPELQESLAEMKYLIEFKSDNRNIQPSHTNKGDRHGSRLRQDEAG